MKNVFLLCGVAMAITFSMHANSATESAEESIYIITAANEAFIANTPGYSHHSSLAGGKYLRVSVNSSMTYDAENYWYSANLNVQKDIELTRPAPVSGYASAAGHQVSASNVTLYNDTLFPSQDSLLNAQTSYAQGMNNFRERVRRPRVAVLDTGAYPHQDYNIKTGYSFTTLFGQSEGDNYLPENTENGKNCIGIHGDQMLGIVGAKQNNALGIAGIVDADLYVGRVMSTSCNPDDPANGGDVGLLSDLYNGIVWATGDYNQVELSEHADVISISLAAETPCPLLLQEAIDNANGKGIAVVVSAGNNSATTARFAPANCAGVITVGAHDENGNIEAYSNTGDHVSFFMHGDYLTTETDHADNAKPSIYTTTSGTSGAAAAASGFAALIKGHFPDVSPAEIKAILQESASCSGVTPCENAINAALLPAISEHVLDPEISFNHVFSGQSCQDNKQELALSSVIDVCGAYTVNVKSDLTTLGNTYLIKVMKKQKSFSHIDWNDTSGKIEVVGSYSITENDESIGLKNVDHSDFDYAAVACYEDFCPSPVVLDLDESQTPLNCR